MRCSFSEIHRLLELRRAGPGEREKRADSVAVFGGYALNGYVCAIDKEWLTGSYPRRTVNEADLWGLFPWVWIYENPKVVTGEGACLYQR